MANGTECSAVDVFTAKGAKIAGNVFGVESAVVDDKLSSLAKIAGNVNIQMGLVLIVTGWANLTIERILRYQKPPGRAYYAVHVAGTGVGGAFCACFANTLLSLILIHSTRACFAGCLACLILVGAELAGEGTEARELGRARC